MDSREYKVSSPMIKNTASKSRPTSGVPDKKVAASKWNSPTAKTITT